MRHDEAEVGADEPILGIGGGGDGCLQGRPLLALGEALGGIAAGFDDAGQLTLFFSVEQGNLSDVIQVETDRVIHGNCSQLLCGIAYSGGILCRLTRAEGTPGDRHLVDLPGEKLRLAVRAG